MMTLALILASLPVTTPEQMGRLEVLASIQTPASSTIVLRYENDTGRRLVRARLECVLVDARGSVVDMASAELVDLGPGAVRTERVRVVDSSQRAKRAECRVATAR